MHFGELGWRLVTLKAGDVVVQSGRLNGNSVMLRQIGPLLGRHRGGSVEKCFLSLFSVRVALATIGP